MHLKSIQPINFEYVKDVRKSLRAFCIIMCLCISFCLKGGGVLLKFQEPLLFPTEYCAMLINDVNITEFIREKGNTIVWILCQKHMATLMRAPPVSFLQNITQIWSQMIDAHHIFNSSIVVYLYVVSPMFCLHNGAFKEQEVARQKLLSGGGKHMKWCRERRSEVNLWNLWRNHLGGLNCKWENIERWWFKALSKHFYNTEQSPKQTWKQS